MQNPTHLTGPCAKPLPEWVPHRACLYLAHTEAGISIRALARAERRHASTVLRQIRRYELRRDDPLCDSALSSLSRMLTFQPIEKDPTAMTAVPRSDAKHLDDTKVNREARRILRRLCETGAFLAIATDMEKAAVLKESPDGQTTRIAVMDRVMAEVFAVKDWIELKSKGRVTTYVVTQVGRAALKRLLAAEDSTPNGFAEAQASFANQHREWATKHVMTPDDDDSQAVRYNLAESPLLSLARRKDKAGKPFLDRGLVAAGERLREDFELAQMGPRVAQNWDRFLTAGDRGGFGGGDRHDGAMGARERVATALRDLGPGLGDVVLRCCCYLEGLEAAEKRLGWSARSGKIVLRIALLRLKQHYDGLGRNANLIG